VADVGHADGKEREEEGERNEEIGLTILDATEKQIGAASSDIAVS